MGKCKHEKFNARVNVNRLMDSGRYTADVTVWCIQCKKSFRFLGLPAGLDLSGASVSVDGKEARLSIAPEDEVLSALEGAPEGFSIKMAHDTQATAKWALVEYLRQDEADVVEILCDNQDGPPNNAIECRGFWTDWKTMRFEGETMLEALQAAMNCRRPIEKERERARKGKK